MKALRNNKVKIFLTVLLVYLFYISPAYLTANTNRYIALAKVVIDEKTFTIDSYSWCTRDRASYNGHCYVAAAPGLGLTAVPVYIGLKPFLHFLSDDFYKDEGFSILNLFFSFFFAVLPGAIIAVLLYNLLQTLNLKEKERMLIVFASSFGTLLFFYSTKFMAHTMGAFTLFSAFYMLFISRDVPEKKYLYFLTGICLGMAVLLDYILIIGSAIFLLYAISNFKKTRILNYIFLILGSSLVALLYMYYHYKCFGNPFKGAFAYGYMYSPGSVCLTEPKVIYELTFGTYRGMFMYMPILLVAVYGIYAFFRKPERKFLKEMIFISLFSFSVFLMICGYRAWDAGGAFGQRYFVCFIPFLMIPVAFAYRRISFRVIFWIVAISIFINWCGVQYGDADSVFTNIGLFVFRGLNSNLAEWAYRLTTTYIRPLNVITHFSPLVGFIALLGIIYLIWKTELDKLAQLYFCKTEKK